MSRPIKQGLDYFPMDVDLDDKFEFIEAKHGITGFGIIIKIYQKIFKEGYFLKWTDETASIFSKKTGVSIGEISAIFDDCFRCNIFSKAVFSRYKVLTSAGIQKRFCSAIQRRKEVNLCKSLLLIDVNLLINVYINWVNVDNNTQRKGEKRKEEERRGETPAFTPPTLDEVKAYFKENGYTETAAIKAFNHYEAGDWFDTNGKPVKNWKRKMNMVWFEPKNKIVEEKQWMPS